MPDPTSYSALGWAIVILVGIVTGINQVMRLLDRFKVLPDPATTYATKQELRQIAEAAEAKVAEAEAQVMARVAEVEARQEASRTQRESDRAALRGEMQMMRGEIRGDIQRLHERLDDIPNHFNHRFDGLTERIIATLRNTGAIGQHNDRP